MFFRKEIETNFRIFFLEASSKTRVEPSRKVQDVVQKGDDLLETHKISYLKEWWFPIQGGPLPVIDWVITPISSVIATVTRL